MIVMISVIVIIVRVLQSLTRVTRDLIIMIIIISDIITSNDTHTHPPHTITGFIWQHSPQCLSLETTLVTSNNGLIMPGPCWVATGNINNTHQEPRCYYGNTLTLEPH